MTMIWQHALSCWRQTPLGRLCPHATHLLRRGTFKHGVNECLLIDQTVQLERREQSTSRVARHRVDQSRRGSGISLRVITMLDASADFPVPMAEKMTEVPAEP